MGTIAKTSDKSPHGNSLAAEKERFHYHHGLKAGDNTLNAHLCRLLLRHIAKQRKASKEYKDAAFAQDFIDYMTNKDGKSRTDDDAYLEIYIRRFFESYSEGKDALNCAARQQDIWSIGSHGGVIRPLIMSLLHYKNVYKAIGISMQHQIITHRSENVSSSLTYLIPILLNVVNGKMTLEEQLRQNETLYLGKLTGKEMVAKYRAAKGPSNIEKNEMYRIHTEYNVENGPFDVFKMEKEMKEEDVIRFTLSTACYTEHGLPLILYIMVHCGFGLKKCLLLNANCGGDNVHRGAILGMMLGATIFDKEDANYKELQDLKKGLKNYKDIENEIVQFVDCICK